jgi:adenylyltransferase/sulfurtransferase
MRLEEKKRSGNYRDLFPEQPGQSDVMNCADAGVLGVLPGIIGSMQANETIKLITGIGKSLIDQLLTYNAIDNNTFTFNYSSSSSVSKMPMSEKEFLEMNYEEECLSDINFVIDAEKFDGMRLQNNLKVIDVREKDELPLATEFENIKIPLGELKNRLNELTEEKIIFFCQSGSRSVKAATMAAEHFGSMNRFFSLKGGIVAWKKNT